jgi:ABC-2 type transport system permease protein
MSSEQSQMSGSRVFAAYLGDIRFELLKMARTPAFAVPTIIFPAMFYLLFGVLVGGGGKDPQFMLQGLARWGVFGVMAPGLFGFGVSLAFEREQGLLVLKQAMPMPSGSYLVGRMVNAMVFVLISALLLISIAVFIGHTPLGFFAALRLLLVDVLGVLPFCAIGLFVGALISGQAAPAIINLIYLPMAFLSGLLVPLQFLPKALQALGPVWPPYHLTQLSAAAVGVPWAGSLGSHLTALIGVTVLFFMLAMRRLGSRGISLLGPSSPAGASFPLRRAVNLVLMAIAIGLVTLGVLGGSAPHATTDVAVTSKGESVEGSAAPPVADQSTAPLGVAAPASPVIAEFDGGSADSTYGIGFTAVDDKMRGGNSSVSQQLVVGGAAHTKAALEVTGDIGTAIAYPFAGASFLPNGKSQTEFSKQGYMDYSSRHTLRFDARGDGRNYLVIIMGPQLDAIPAMYNFVAGPEWQEVRVPLRDLGGLDLHRVKAISIGSMNPGAFRFQIDGVRIE